MTVDYSQTQLSLILNEDLSLDTRIRACGTFSQAFFHTHEEDTDMRESTLLKEELHEIGLCILKTDFYPFQEALYGLLEALRLELQTPLMWTHLCRALPPIVQDILFPPEKEERRRKPRRVHMNALNAMTKLSEAFRVSRCWISGGSSSSEQRLELEEKWMDVGSQYLVIYPQRDSSSVFDVEYLSLPLRKIRTCSFDHDDHDDALRKIVRITIEPMTSAFSSSAVHTMRFEALDQSMLDFFEQRMAPNVMRSPHGRKRKEKTEIQEGKLNKKFKSPSTSGVSCPSSLPPSSSSTAPCSEVDESESVHSDDELENLSCSQSKTMNPQRTIERAMHELEIQALARQTLDRFDESRLETLSSVQDHVHTRLREAAFELHEAQHQLVHEFTRVGSSCLQHQRQARQQEHSCTLVTGQSRDSTLVTELRFGTDERYVRPCVRESFTNGQDFLMFMREDLEVYDDYQRELRSLDEREVLSAWDRASALLLLLVGLVGPWGLWIGLEVLEGVPEWVLGSVKF